MKYNLSGKDHFGYCIENRQSLAGEEQAGLAGGYCCPMGEGCLRPCVSGGYWSNSGCVYKGEQV